ncbi:TRAP transporter small permease [Kordiimonas sp.]|uniref:TRAP transporter small permease n=1 Tax=Kordiimonas sp. TaxID=1970157 RepID=UPI003A93D126
MTAFVSILTTMSVLGNKVCKTVASVGILVMLLCILYQIAARYIFNEPPAWPEELARYAMIWAGFTGATVAFKAKTDPTLFNAENLINPHIRKLSKALEAIAVFAFWVPVLLAMPKFIELQSTRASEALEIPNVYIMLIMPVCVLIILLHLSVRLLGGSDKSN